MVHTFTRAKLRQVRYVQIDDEVSVISTPALQSFPYASDNPLGYLRFRDVKHPESESMGTHGTLYIMQAANRGKQSQDLDSSHNRTMGFTTKK
jgi:hypothetical protein